MSAANQYIKQVLHHPEAPPAIEARFFYTSPLPIDDPLSPVPPPTGAKAPLNQPPKPFSDYDNRALDKAWHDLRRKILKYNEEQSEKSVSREGSRSRAGSGATPSRLVRRGSRRGSGSNLGTTRKPTARAAASSLSHVDGPPDTHDIDGSLEEHHVASEYAAVPDTTGTPFIRAPSGKRLSDLKGVDEPKTRPKVQTHDTYAWDDSSHLVEHSPVPEKRSKDESPKARVAVGASRLHQVEMPELLMQPIYWAPVHDTAQVVRGTWFYQDTMLPVETNVANMLEAGYVDLRVWTETWKDELNSAVDVGSEGEMKIVHKLWPEKVAKSAAELRLESRQGPPYHDNLMRTATSNISQGEPETPEQLRERAVEAACDIVDISTGPGGADNKAAGKSTYGRGGPPRNYAPFGVIYANEREARLLKPNLLPSAYYGRRPLANYIRKGHKLGVPVVRGFDQAAWDKLYPTKQTRKAEKAAQGLATAASGAPPSDRRKSDSELAASERPKVSDLILVVHGIGQKLSQRMESFHFTHAMNTFRRDINVEVGTNDVKSHFREEMGSIMVLPINWRHNLSFEEGGYRDGPEDPTANEFTLQDITPETLPSVRNIVSDVMLDIPYYMSHHQPKIVGAVVSEANRVYKLWCQNNPGFAQHGRVHLIGHSLGSVLAMDILSRQPTTIPKHLSDPTAVNFEAEKLDHFLFNTSNLFLAGSPAGFFLLLKRAQLVPRLENKDTSLREADSNNLSVCGEQGQYGCIPVENIYNIINPYDPVGYRMNAAVDSQYASSIKQAWLPTATAGWFGTRSSTNWFAGSGSALSGSGGDSNKPPALPRLPSNVELETHNFTREEVAEKRMYLLNDNGQIDYFLRYGGGPLEIQYLTMLGAHSSYWLLKDFTRMIALEVGRERGREGTLFAMRAAKRKVQ
ncbi:hypothetical protein D0869_08041 [Hortaea werneckii]|uniref:DDHD domain-containing protein n=1 Tax=Hortaea werneckii TaxID=91943 RepID=A0A3M6WMN8_HORWE|nr:hypothetical protein D0869_08041 [Hortaea werneckii]RMX91856.1 hypothetical protein D0868_13741 [Hortaea werneckii]